MHAVVIYIIGLNYIWFRLDLEVTKSGTYMYMYSPIVSRCGWWGEGRLLPPWRHRQNSAPNFPGSALRVHVYIHVVRMQDKEGMDWHSVVLLRVSRLEGRWSDTDDQPSSHETRSDTAKRQSIPSLSCIVALNVCSMILSTVHVAAIVYWLIYSVVRMYMYRFFEFPCVLFDYVKLKYASKGCHGYPNIQQSRHVTFSPSFLRRLSWTTKHTITKPLDGFWDTVQCVSLIIHVGDSLDHTHLVNCLDLIWNLLHG